MTDYVKCGACSERTYIDSSENTECVQCGDNGEHRHDNGEMLCGNCYHEYDNDIYEVHETTDDDYNGDRDY